MSESDSTQMREFLSLLTNTISFIGTETANLVRDKANRNVTGAEGINARAEEIDEAVTKLEAMSRYVALRVDDGTELSKRGRLAAKLPQGEQTKMTVAEQLTRAVLKARANKLTNTRAFVRCPNDVRLERLERELPLNDSIALR